MYEHVIQDNAFYRVVKDVILMRMQKVILFDFFGVICPDIGKAILMSQSRERAHKKSMLYKLHATYTELSKRVQKSFTHGAPVPLDAVPVSQDTMGDIDCVDPEMLTLIRELKRLGHRIGIASNANHAWIHAILAKDDVSKLFEHIVISSSVGFIKPDERFFVKICDAFQCSTDDCILVDDNAYNVESAQRFGMHGIRYTSMAKLRTELMHLGVL